MEFVGELTLGLLAQHRDVFDDGLLGEILHVVGQVDEMVGVAGAQDEPLLNITLHTLSILIPKICHDYIH